MKLNMLMAIAATFSVEQVIKSKIKQAKRIPRACLNASCHHETDHKSGFCSAQCNKGLNK